MSQNAEAAAFIARIAQLPPGPNASLDDVLKPSIDDEASLRRLFAQDRGNSRLQDPYVGLVDVFAAPAEIRKTRARVVQTEADMDAMYVMPLSEDRRRKEGAPAMVDNLQEFKQNWAIFTEGSLSQLTDWSNIVVAGGAVQACLAPVPESAKASKRALRKHFHSQAFPSSDVDLFLYGMTPEQAEVKMNTIYEAVRDSIPWDVTCIRTKHTVSIHSQYPYRAVQIVLRLYHSPAEILAGFDVDAPCCAFDGERVYANPRAIVAMMRQCNTIDVTRRSPSYEVRLAKYSHRDFEIYVPQLKRGEIDPTIFERSIVRIQGLARLLVLEKLTNATAREGFVQSRRTIRGRPQKSGAWRRLLKRKYKGDLKGEIDEELEMADYDVVALHIPYGPGWDAKRIDKLVYQTDLSMNSPFNPRNKGRKLHRHAAFFGTMKECMDDCCELCPDPQNDEERTLVESEEKSYLRGRIQFIAENPGRQSMSGSFNPIDEGEWSDQAYMGATEKFFLAIASHDRQAVAAAIKGGIDVDRRDHVGRTPLQVAIISEAIDVACDLIDAGARMTARLVDGRTALHLAAQLNLSSIVRKLFERSARNAEEAKVKEEEAKRIEEAKAQKSDTGDDDVEMGDGDEDKDDVDEDEDEDGDDDDDDDDEDKDTKTSAKSARNDPGTIPDDEKDVPDVFEIDTIDWDYAFSALDYAVVSGSTPVVELLLAAGANPKLVTKPASVDYAHPLLLTAANADDSSACATAEKLIAAGAITSEADDDLLTVLHRAVLAGRPKILSTMIRSDRNSKPVLDIPRLGSYQGTVYPIVSAIITGSYATLATLLAYGAKLHLTEADFQRAKDLRTNNHGSSSEFHTVAQPIETALVQCDDVLRLLLALGADTTVPIVGHYNNLKASPISPLDYTRVVPRKLPDGKKAKPVVFDPLPLDDVPTWKAKVHKLINDYEDAEYKKSLNAKPTQRGNTRSSHDNEAKKFYEEAEQLLLAHGAKSGAELYPNDKSEELRLAEAEKKFYISSMYNYWSPGPSYSIFMQQPYGFFRAEHNESDKGVHSDMAKRYEELFDACWNGDNAKIQRLCLPSQKSSVVPLQIAAWYGPKWQRGYTPLSLAVMQRKWDTAKLIIAIATAQYSPVEKKQEKFTTRNLALEDDDSGSDDDSMSEDEGPPEEPEVSLVDIAKRPSELRTKASPAQMFYVYAPLGVFDGQAHYGTLLMKAIMEDDFETFIQILDLTMSLPAKDWRLQQVVTSLIQYDRPAMLDEIIRRCGLGVNFAPEGSPEGSPEDDETQDSTKPRKADMYLGLNVHGMKRKDLASQGDPDAPTDEEVEEVPILWTAASRGSAGIVRYFASDQPLAAYRFYAATHSDKRAQAIKNVQDLPSVLPEKLGWLPNNLNETVATAAIIGNKLGVLESLITMRGEEIEAALHVKQRMLGYNSILAAARWAVDPELFDFLLARGVSPIETDSNGCNVYHLLCGGHSLQHFKLLKHVLRIMPKDVTERLLRQQSKGIQATPLHMAVKEGHIDVVELLVAETSVPQQYLLREAGGSTPLQLAVSLCFAKITRILATNGPAEALTLEDGVGTTPLESVGRKAFEVRLSQACVRRVNAMDPTQPRFNKQPFVVDDVEKEVRQLREIVKDLTAEGRIVSGTKLARELDNFAQYMEDKIAKTRASAETSESADVKPEDTRQSEKASPAEDVLAIIVEALRARPGPRRLVHLADVHESVRKSLEEFSPKAAAEQSKRYHRYRRRSRRRTDMDDIDSPLNEQEKKTSQMTRYYEEIYNLWEGKECD